MLNLLRLQRQLWHHAQNRDLKMPLDILWRGHPGIEDLEQKDECHRQGSAPGEGQHDVALFARKDWPPGNLSRIHDSDVRALQLPREARFLRALEQFVEHLTVAR